MWVQPAKTKRTQKLSIILVFDLSMIKSFDSKQHSIPQLCCIGLLLYQYIYERKYQIQQNNIATEIYLTSVLHIYGFIFQWLLDR